MLLAASSMTSARLAIASVWDSTMFNADDWSLRVGPGEMGGFTKDWLAAKKDADQALAIPMRSQ